MKEQEPVSGLNELLGLQNQSAAHDLTAYRRLAQLKAHGTLSEEQLNAGFADLLNRREATVPKRKHRTVWWVSGAAAVALLAVTTLLIVNYTTPKTPQIVAADLGGSVPADQIELRENRLISAKIETVDLQIRGVTKFSAQSSRDELFLRFDTGFLNIEYHPDAHRKRLVVKVRDATFTVTGTKFYVQALPEVRLVVIEGRVAAEKAGKTTAVTQSQMWTEENTEPQKITSAESEAFAKGFADTAKPASEVSISQAQKKPVLPAPKGVVRVKLHMGLGEVISGVLTGEDAESVSIVTAGGKTLRINRSEIERIERMR